MDKNLQLHIGHLLMNCSNLLDRQFTGQDHARKALRLKPAHLLRRPVVRLRRSMDSKVWETEFPPYLEDGHILNQDGTDPYSIQVAQKPTGLLEFRVV